MPGMMTAEEMSKLNGTTGTEFDRAWLDMMIRHHQGAVEMAKTQQEKGSSADAKKLAQDIITAQQAGRYKPDRRPFEIALEQIGLPIERVLHVAQSLYHDHRPARTMGLKSVWIDRRRGRPGTPGGSPRRTPGPRRRRSRT